jgi:ATP/maltotriose-dependent transcriptional regulator MalT
LDFADYIKLTACDDRFSQGYKINHFLSRLLLTVEYCDYYNLSMTIPIISTKLYIPPLRSKVVIRPRLIERLNEGLHRKLTLISASAGFGKTTLVSEWLAGCEQSAAWLSLTKAAAHGIMPDYTGRLLAVFESGLRPAPPAKALIERLSERELNVLQLIAQGLSNREISERLFLALSSVKGHNQNIFGKLQVQRHTEAVARARELGLL